MTAAENLEFQVDKKSVVLVVDDHPVTADMERAYLGSVGFQVLVATDKQEALRMVRENEVDLVIVDMSFGKNQGLSVIQDARRSSKNKEIKFIATSVVGTPANRKSAEKAGAEGFIAKPAPRPKVLKEIKKLVAMKARDTERVKQNLAVELVIGKQKDTASTLDISSEGVHLAFSKKNKKVPAVGTSIELFIPLSKDSKPIEISGEVVRHTAEGFGVRFVEMNKLAQRQLDKFLLTYSMEQRASKYYL